jgi:hypothetical protein
MQYIWYFILVECDNERAREVKKGLRAKGRERKREEEKLRNKRIKTKDTYRRKREKK